jgi:endonuclease-3
MLQEKVAKIIKILRKTYPESRTALHFETPLQILVATILAAQCTDERVNKITPHLFSKYKTVFDFAEAKQSILEQEIRTAGFYRNKAKNIIAAAKKIVDNFNGSVPQSMNELITLPGVARKTANIVLSSGFKKAEGIAVDTHVKRLSGRIGLSKEKYPDKIERDLMRIVPRKDWIDFNYLLVDHGRKVCRARKPLCQECEVKHLCSATK